MNHIPDNFRDLVRPNTNAPTKVFYSVVYTFLPCMAYTLQGIPADCAYTGSCVALAHVDWVGCMSKVETTRLFALLERSDLVARWDRKAETRCWHSLRHGFKCDGWMTVGEGEERGHGASQ
jgi:hypothetical protein